MTGNPIPLAEKEMAFGTDPVQSNHVLDDPSIAPLHARLKQVEDGGFVLSDNGSVAGTGSTTNSSPARVIGCNQGMWYTSAN